MRIRVSQGTESRPGAYADKLDALLNVIAELLVQEAIREHNSPNCQFDGADSNNGSTDKHRGAHV